MGILPVSTFCSGHTFFVQRMADVMGLQPYVVHATFQFSGTPGKRHRMRESLLWDAVGPKSESAESVHSHYLLHGAYNRAFATGQLQQGMCNRAFAAVDSVVCTACSTKHRSSMASIAQLVSTLVPSNSRPLLHNDFQPVSLIMERAEPIQLVNCFGKNLRSLLAQCHTLSLSIRHCHNLDCIQDSSRTQLSCSVKDFYQQLSPAQNHHTMCLLCARHASFSQVS